MPDRREAPPLTGPADLISFVRKIEPYSFLEQIGVVARQEGENTRLGRLFPGPNATQNVFTPWGLAHLARYVLQHGSTFRRQTADTDDVIVGTNIVNGLVDPLPPSESRELRDWGLFLMRLGVKQFAFQTGVRQRLGRLLMLFLDLPDEVPQMKQYGLAGRFKEVTGISVEEFIWTCLYLDVAVATRPIIDIRALASVRRS